MKQKTIDEILEPIVWKLMVGCATGNIEPNEKDDYIDKIKTALKQELLSLIKGIEKKSRKYPLTNPQKGSVKEDVSANTGYSLALKAMKKAVSEL